jgi:ankyrin repeat-rich membrane spanning protein
MAAEGAIEAIHRAAWQGDVDIVTRMLDEDPRLLSSMWDNHTLLSTAVWHGHDHLVTLLLERGAEVNQADEYGDTALICAGYRGHDDIVSTLLTSGADPTRKGYGEETALIRASRSGHGAVVRLLLRSMGGDLLVRVLDERTDDGRTALWYACRRGYADVVRALLLAGADHTIADNDDTTPLQVAQETQHHECVIMLQVSTSFNCKWCTVYRNGFANLCLCCSGGRASCSVHMSSTRPGRYTKTPPHASTPLQPQCPPT